MTIDTADKRKSVSNYIIRVLPIPDNEINDMDRMHIAGFYRLLILSNIDTVDKRKSITNHIIRVLPNPDGIISTSDRIHVAGFYCGLHGVIPRRLSPKFYY